MCTYLPAMQYFLTDLVVTFHRVRFYL